MTTAIVMQARQLLKWSLGLGAIVIGADKFFNVITDWGRYVSDPVADLIPLEVSTFLLVVGVVEIIVGLLILSRATQVGAYFLAGWFALVIINLALIGGYTDIMLRDALLALSSVALGLLYSPRVAFNER